MTAAELAALVEPLAARDTTLRPAGLQCGSRSKRYGYWTLELSCGDDDRAEPFGHGVSVDLAADLWIARMVRWLVAPPGGTVEIVQLNNDIWQVWFYDSQNANGATLIHALAGAITAVLDARDAAAKREAKA